MTAFVDELVGPALLFLGDWSLRWGALIVVLALALGILRLRRAGMRYLACSTVMLAGLCLALLPRWGPGWPCRPQVEAAADLGADAALQIQPTQEHEIATQQGPAPLPPELDGNDSPQPTELSPPVPIAFAPEPLGPKRIVLLGLAGAWCLGIMVGLARWALGEYQLRRLRRTACPAVAQAAKQFAECRVELRMVRAVELAVHKEIHSPILFGFFRPLILVPQDWPGLRPAVQRAGLLHELAHVARGDHRIASLLHLVRIVFFFHPLVRWLLSRMEKEAEILCDEAAVVRGIEPREYARILLEFARRGGRLGPAWVGVGRRATVKSRIHHLLEENMQGRISPLGRRQAVAVGTLLLALAAALGSLRGVAQDSPPAPQQPVKAIKKSEPVPKRPYRIAPFDVLRIRPSSSLPDRAAGGLRLVEADGQLDLGAGYGRIQLGGQTLEQAEATVVKRLKNYVKDIESTSVELAGEVSRWRRDPARTHPYRIRPYQVLDIEVINGLPDQRNNRPHLVDPDGKIDLGPEFGKVMVEGLTLEEARHALQKKLDVSLINPNVSVTLGGWQRVWRDFVKEGPEEPDTPVPPAPGKRALRFGGKSFEQWRMELLTELKPQVQVEGIKALTAFGTNGYAEEAIRAILAVMKGYTNGIRERDDRDVQAVTEAALGACRKLGAAAEPVLREALHSPSSIIRRFAVSGLLVPRAQGAVPELLSLLSDADPGVREIAIIAVNRIDAKAKGAVELFLKALKDPEVNVRIAAASALGDSGAKSAAPSLVRALKDPERSL
jgi:beta-lactamase regulating signal transducer with metallopeptidase domain